MNLDQVIRVGMAVAAAGLFFAPQIRDALLMLPGLVRPSSFPSSADIQTVIDMTVKMKAAGCQEGVALCQKLLDAMLKVQK